ncbi:hypothetical protein JHK87_009117 [Glycine soja]|nr:hypothetical protein JHK87_009117 [Glycine soja]
MVTSTQLKVKNIGFTGVFRLIFNPLVDEFPAFGAVCFSLKEKRDLDFTLKVIGGDLSTLPGISDAIEETIRDAIEDSITWPVRKVIPILPGDYSNLELKPVGILEVKLVQAKNLTNKDIIGKSDPYAVIFVRPLRDRTKTSKIWLLNFLASLKDLEPGKVKDVWLKLVKDLEVHRDNEMLILEVYDHDTFGKEKIGRVILTLTKVILEGEYNETYPLDGAKSGNISLHLKSTPQHKFRDP